MSSDKRKLMTYYEIDSFCVHMGIQRKCGSVQVHGRARIVWKSLCICLCIPVCARLCTGSGEVVEAVENICARIFSGDVGIPADLTYG